MRSLFLFLLSFLLGPALAWSAPNAREILTASDAIRNPGRPFSVTVTLTEFQAGKQVDTSTLVSYSRTERQGDQFASLIRFVLPARDAGKLMLKNGNDMWFYDPASKASVRLSPQQRLLGQASNGDVATVNLAKDYQATLVGDEEIMDGERRTRMAHKLALTAVAPDATYASIEMWVDAENNRPLKARFFAESSRLLKTAYYRHFQLQLGAERPTETVIIDGLNPQSVTLMRFSDYKARAIPDSWMQRDFLPRFQPN
ncbi:outer membrane lipoprotein-sorting protein [Polaromonas sp. C04]|uniref:outer membrane lipoprotein-sorting protein n=1 Tax=Polaromonas sp. C04 TaxID=1945857 RepID=UPI000984A190|nr:outer membrane lipoprotein-sorting protein [Polaromonas sp. C04]OOG51424.1 outer membrane lipoprotein-sorting protein [Polaromonas sp. C04]